MNIHAGKKPQTQNQPASFSAQKTPATDRTVQRYGEITSESNASLGLQESVDESPVVQQLKSYQEMANDSPQVRQLRTYKAMADSSSQRHEPTSASVQERPEPPAKENKTGLPDELKSGIENISRYSMDDVRVHRNSDKPAQMQAYAYAQGTDIHLAAGQEKHLAHEAWHVVQQKQGRVKPTGQMKGELNINDDSELEKEADSMGEKATGAYTLDPPSQLKEAAVDKTIQLMPWPIVAGIAALGAAAVWGLYRAFRGGGEDEEDADENEEPAHEGEEDAGHEAEALRDGEVPADGAEEEAAGPPIAARMHFVWLGGQVPNQRRDNILRWCAAMGRETVIRLWMDDNSIAASTGQIELLQRANVQIANINTLAEGDERVAAAVGRLPTVREGRVVPPATGALSDIVRLAALQAEGGTYMDSDNLPASGSSALVGGQAPAGFRLGNVSGVMSNDAISAHRDDAFIEQYLERACNNLTNEQALIIMGGGRAAVDAVMTTTGPQALATLPLPDAGPLLAIAARYPDAFGEVPSGQLTISHLRNLQGYAQLMTEPDRSAVNAYTNRIGMSAFQREQGNAWLPESGSSGGSSGAAGGGVPAFVPPAVPLALPLLHVQNLAAIAAANAVGTFSPEFIQFRDHRVAAMQTLVNGGLDPATVNTINAALNLAFAAQGAPAQVAHPAVPIQEAIFDAVDPLHGRSLWALLRVFRAHGL